MRQEGADRPAAELRPDLVVSSHPMEVLLARRICGSPAGADHVMSPRTAARILAAISEGTRRAYTADWTRFTAWCTSAGRTPLPCSPETLAEFVSVAADREYAPASSVG